MAVTSQAITVDASKSPDLDLLDASIGDVSGAEYASASFNVRLQEAFPTGVFFSSDGTKMFIVGSNSDAVYQYSLATAWDISTASYDDVSFDVSLQETSISGITFSTDGTKMFIVGSNSDAVYQYSLATAWDISTASYDDVSFDVILQENSPLAITFSTDGTKMFIVGSIFATVYQYSLTTAWDISTASYDSVSLNISLQATVPTGITFFHNGTKMFIVGSVSDNVQQYSLTTPWDLSTASYDDVSFNVFVQDSSPNDVAFSPDGTKMFIAGLNTGVVYTYDMPIDAGITSDDIIIPDDYRTATDGVSVTINTTHNDRTSLSFRLRNPAGDWSDIHNIDGMPSSQSFDLTFLNTSDTDGTWRLEITDDEVGEAGTLDSWELNITTTNVAHTVTASDSLSIMDSITKMQSRTKSLSDFLSITDSISKSKAIIRLLQDPKEALGDAVFVASPINNMYGMAGTGAHIIECGGPNGGGYFYTNKYNYATDNFTVGSITGSTSRTMRACAYADGKILESSVNPDVVYDWDIDNTTGLVSTPRQLTVDQQPNNLQGMAYHAKSGKIIGCDNSSDALYDWDYDPVAGTLSNRRTLTGFTLGNPRSVAIYGNTLMVSDIGADKFYAMTYDSVAGSVTEQRPFSDEANVHGATFVNNRLFFLRANADIYYRQYTPMAFSISDSVTRMQARTKSLSDSLSITDRLSLTGQKLIHLTDSLTIADSVSKMQTKIKSLFDSLSIADSLNHIKEARRTLSDTLTITDALHVVSANTLRLADRLSISDSITRMQSRTKSLSDSLFITDAISKFKSVTRALSESGTGTSVTTPDTLSDASLIGVALLTISLRGMAYHAGAGRVYHTSVVSSLSTIHSRQYADSVLAGTQTEQATISGATLTALAVAGNKMLAVRVPPAAAIHDFDIDPATGALSGQRTLIVTNLPSSIQGMAVHANSGKVILSDTSADVLHDYDYDAAGATLDNPRALTVSDGVFTPTNARSISVRGDKIILANRPTARMYSYDYDAVNGTISGETELANETNVQASTFIDNILVFARTDRTIHARTFTPGSTTTAGGGISITDAVARTANHNVLLSESLSVADSLTKMKSTIRSLANSLAVSDAVVLSITAIRSLSDSLSIADRLAIISAGTVRLSDRLSITDTVTRMQSRTISLSSSLSIRDAVTAAQTQLIVLSSRLSIRATVTRTQSKIRSLSSSISIMDALTLMSANIKSLSDSLSISDSVTKSTAFTRALTSRLSISDRLHIPQDYIVSLTDRLSISDSVLAFTRNITVSRVYRATLNRVFRASYKGDTVRRIK